MIDAIKISGLNEFTRALKKVDKDLPKAMRVAFNASAQVVLVPARQRVPHKRGRAQNSIKAKSTQKLVRISAGGSRAPYYPWLDFGGRVGRKNSVERQFRKKGRYLYIEYYKQRDAGAFQEALQAALKEVADKGGLDVKI